MFNELGAMMKLMGNKNKIQEEVLKLQSFINNVSAEGKAGAGYVTVRVNGRMEILNVTISPEAMALNDREMLEDLIAAATNQALNKAKVVVAEETAKMATNVGLPASMLGGGLPGLG